jgi:hypothetical protein
LKLLFKAGKQGHRWTLKIAVFLFWKDNGEIRKQRERGYDLPAFPYLWKFVIMLISSHALISGGRILTEEAFCFCNKKKRKEAAIG